MVEVKVIEHEQKAMPQKDGKIQIQVKGKFYSKSLTIHNFDIEYAHNLIYMMFKSFENSKGDAIRLICRKPPQTQKNDIPPA